MGATDVKCRNAVQTVKELEKAGGRRKKNQFLVEGDRLLRRALKSGMNVERIYVTADWLDAQVAGWVPCLACEVVVLPDPVMDDLIKGRSFGSVLAVLRMPQAPSLDALLDCAKSRLLILDKVMDPGNLGALMRTSLATGVSAMICCGGTDPFHPKAARTSMGAIFELPIMYLDDRRWSLEALAARIRAAGMIMIGAVTQEGEIPRCSEAMDRMALFVGSEAHGLPSVVCDAMDICWQIPMTGGVDSFSVNAAAAILLYELNRPVFTQR